MKSYGQPNKRLEELAKKIEIEYQKAKVAKMKIEIAFEIKKLGLLNGK